MSEYTDQSSTIVILLQTMNTKLQKIIENQDRDYNAARDYEKWHKEQYHKDEREHDQHLREVQERLSTMFGGIDVKEIMKMAQKQMGDMFDDKKSFDTSILRKEPRKYDKEKEEEEEKNVSKDGEISP